MKKMSTPKMPKMAKQATKKAAMPKSGKTKKC